MMRAIELFTPLLFSRAATKGSVETDFVEQLRRGDAAALGRVYDEHYSAVRTFARRFIGEDAAAEDVAHDVFVDLPKMMGNFRGESSLRTFLLSIAVNYARHHVRAASRRRAAMERLALEPVSAVPSPEHQMRRAALAAALNRALDALPISQRLAFILCEVEERSAREAADIMGVPEATARTRLFHAKQKLRTLLEQEGVQ